MLRCMLGLSESFNAGFIRSCPKQSKTGRVKTENALHNVYIESTP